MDLRLFELPSKAIAVQNPIGVCATVRTLNITEYVKL